MLPNPPESFREAGDVQKIVGYLKWIEQEDFYDVDTEPTLSIPGCYSSESNKCLDINHPP